MEKERRKEIEELKVQLRDLSSRLKILEERLPEFANWLDFAEKFEQKHPQWVSET